MKPAGQVNVLDARLAIVKLFEAYLVNDYLWIEILVTWDQETTEEDAVVNTTSNAHESLNEQVAEPADSPPQPTAEQNAEPCGSPGTPCVPTSLTVISVRVLPPCNSGKTTDCGSPRDTPYGLRSASEYQVNDQNGDPLEQEGLVPREEISLTTVELFDGNILTIGGADKTIGPNLDRNSSNTGVTDGKGRFVDAPFGVSWVTPMKKATVTQKIYFKDGKKKLKVRKNNIKIVGTRTTNAGMNTYR